MSNWHTTLGNLFMAYWALHEHGILMKSLYEGSSDNERTRWWYCLSLHCSFYGTTLASLSVGQSGTFWENCLKNKGNWPMSAYPFCCRCSVSLHRENPVNPVSWEPEDIQQINAEFFWLLILLWRSKMKDDVLEHRYDRALHGILESSG